MTYEYIMYKKSLKGFTVLITFSCKNYSDSVIHKENIHKTRQIGSSRSTNFNIDFEQIFIVAKTSTAIMRDAEQNI